MKTQAILQNTNKVIENQMYKLEAQHAKIMLAYKKETNWNEKYTIKGAEMWKEIETIEEALLHLRKIIKFLEYA